MKNKKLIIISIVILILFIIIVSIIINKKSSKIIRKETIDFNIAFEVENINDSKYKIEKTKDMKIASKYSVFNDIYKLDANVKLGDRNGELIYVRNNSQKLNIYQTKYRIDELNFNEQIERYIEVFRSECINYIGTAENPTSEMIYGDSKNSLPVSENIYLNNRLYTILYEIKDDNEQQQEVEIQSQKFEINFYRNESYLMCEFVKIIN